MRQGTNPKRLRGRGNGRKHPPRNQNFESNGPEVKVRGNAQQVVERYLALARDASSAGDRVAAENYFQHAEHYFRIMTANGGLPGNREQSHHDAAQLHDGVPQPDIGGPQPDIVPQPQMAPQAEQRPPQPADPPQEESDPGGGEDGGTEPIPV